MTPSFDRETLKTNTVLWQIPFYFNSRFDGLDYEQAKQKCIREGVPAWAEANRCLVLEVEDAQQNTREIALLLRVVAAKDEAQYERLMKNAGLIRELYFKKQLQNFDLPIRRN